jgi:hypothetical protein
MLVPDLAHATTFLDLLEPGGLFTFQTFADCPAASVYPGVLHGTLSEHATELTRLNQGGAGVFVMVNAGDGEIKPGAKTCRTQANVIRVRGLFVDLDGAPIAPVLASALLPDWVVRSSPGRWHAYWRVNDCPLDRFEAVQAALATRFDGDTKVKDLPRVMRIPGFFHRKADPFRSELWEPTSYSKVKEMNHE